MARIPEKLLTRVQGSVSGMRLGDDDIAALRPAIEAGLDAPFLVSMRELKGLHRAGIELTIRLHLFDDEDGAAS